MARLSSGRDTGVWKRGSQSLLGCDHGPNKSPCCLLFMVAYYQLIRNTLSEFEPQRAGPPRVGSDHVQHLSGLHSGWSSQLRSSREEENVWPVYHIGHRVCQTTFLLLHTIGFKRSYIKNGPVVRVHGNKGRKPSTSPKSRM